MSKRILSLLAVFVLALVLSTAVSAQNVPDMSQDGTGSIHVNLNYAEGTSPRGSLTLYYVGEIAEDDGNYTFAPTGAFAEKWEVYDDVLSPCWPRPWPSLPPRANSPAPGRRWGPTVP